MSGETEWRWADPQGQQRLIRTDELRAALSNGVIPPNAPVWQAGWSEWKAAFDVPELTSSALSAANGVVPNIPPPPLFVVAAQTAFEGAPVAPKTGAVGEPPPPPRYVPAPVRAPEVPVPASKAPASIKTSMGPALAGPPSRPPMSQRSAPPISQRMSATEALKRAVPSQPKLPVPAKPVPAAPDTQPDVGAAARKAPAAASAGKPGSLSVPTMMGVPRIGDPRATASSSPPPLPLGAKGPVQTPLMPTVADRGPPGAGRATLLLDGSAPKTPLPHEGAVPPIVAPGGHGEKNAVTRPPPADHGTVRVDGAMRAKQDSSEELSGSMLIEHSDGSAMPTIGKPSQPPPVPPPRSVKPAPPGLRALASGAPRALSRPPAPPIDAAPNDSASVRSVRVPSTPPPVPASARGSKPATPPPPPTQANTPPPRSAGIGLASPTLMGVGPIPSPGPPPADLMAQVNEASRPSFPDETSRALVANPEWLEKVLTRFPALRPLQKGRPIFFLPVVGGLAALVAFLVVGLLLRGIVSLFSSGDDPKANANHGGAAAATASTTATATASPTVPPAATEAPTASATPSAEPAARPAIPCRGTSVTKVLAPKALVASGVEVVSLGKSIGVGFASSPKDGVALELDASSLAVLGTAKAKGVELKRVTPIQVGGRLVAAADSDKREGALASARTVSAATPFALGVNDGSLAWAPRRADGAPQNLWSLSGDAPVEALRASSAGAGYVLAFRRGPSVVFGQLGAGMHPAGSLVQTAGQGPQVGSPSVAASGDVSLVMWADRASADAPWGIRMRRITSQGAEDPIAFAPAGGLGAPFIAPNVVGLGGRRFFVVWTEGPAQSHQVRGVTLDATGQPEGAPFVLSAPGANAGQAQAALTDGAKGVVAFLVSSGKSFELVAAGVTCAPP